MDQKEKGDWTPVGKISGLHPQDTLVMATGFLQSTTQLR